jgi:hypothetical protein
MDGARPALSRQIGLCVFWGGGGHMNDFIEGTTTVQFHHRKSPKAGRCQNANEYAWESWLVPRSDLRNGKQCMCARSSVYGRTKRHKMMNRQRRPGTGKTPTDIHGR